MADAPFGKFKNILPNLGSKKEDTTPEENFEGEDNSRGQKVSKKQHDVLIQLNIKAQTELDGKVLTPSKVKTVGFHTSEEGGYSFKEVEEFHELAVKTVDWYANKLFERDNDVRKLATEVDKYITDFQNMKIEIELLTSEVDSMTVDQDSISKIDTLEEKILRLERENATLKSQNALLKSQPSENKESPKKEESPVNGALNNTERTHLEELESWAAEVTVMYDQMERNLTASNSQIAELQGNINYLNEQVKNNSGNEELELHIAELTTNLAQVQEAYNTLSDSYTDLEDKFGKLEAYATEAENYSKEMDAYAKQLLEQIESMSAGSVQEYEPVEEAVVPTGPAYNIPEGVSLDDL